MNKQLSFGRVAICLLLLLGNYCIATAQLPNIQVPVLGEGPYCAGTTLTISAPFTGFPPNTPVSFTVTAQIQGAVSVMATAPVTGSSNASGSGTLSGSILIPNVPGGAYQFSVSTVINLPGLPPIPLSLASVPISISSPPAPDLTNQTVNQNTPLTLTATNCSGTINWTGPGSTSGVGSIPVNTSQTGQLNYSATCTIAGCTGPSTNITVSVNPVNQGFQLTAPTYNCQTGAFRFNTTGGDNSQIEYYAVPGITGWTTNPNQFVDAELRTAPDAPIIILKARQNGVEVSYVWNIRQVCPLGDGLKPNQSPSLVVPIPNQTATVGQFFSYTFPSNTFIDNNGDQLTYTISGLPQGLNLTGSTISGTPGQAGNYTVGVTATDPGGLATTSIFTLKVNSISQGTFSLVAPTYNCQTGAFRFNTTGGDNSPIEYYAVPGITGWTTNPNQFVDFELRTAADAPIIILIARQNGVEVSYAWNIREVCPVSARTGVAEANGEFDIRVIGNPVQDEAVVELRGAHNQPVSVQLLDIQGRPLIQENLLLLNPVEQIKLSVGDQPTGILFLRASTATQSRTLRLLKL